jgi:putative membrane protein
MAAERTTEATMRTRMAVERTLMAWIRTSLSMISFGITILKLFEYLQGAEGPFGMVNTSHTRRLGIVLIVVGTSILIPATVQAHRRMKELSALDGKSPWTLSLLIAGLVAIFGILSLASGLFNWLF